MASVVGLTGQYWKLGVGIGALLVGSVAPLFAVSGINWTSGTIIACVGYVYSVAFVRCPACGSRWFWQAALDATWYPPLFKGSACPACKHDFRAGH